MSTPLSQADAVLTEIRASRAKATESVASGGGLLLAGVGLLTAGAFGLLGAGSFVLGLGGAALLGGGLMQVGSALAHVARFGSRNSIVTTGAVGALGGVLAVWPVLAALQVLGIWRAPLWFRQTYPIALLGVGIVALFLVLRSLAYWALERDHEVGDGARPSTPRP